MNSFDKKKKYNENRRSSESFFSTNNIIVYILNEYIIKNISFLFIKYDYDYIKITF